jgi:predicted MFS family arabinose efflux permease
MAIVRSYLASMDSSLRSSFMMSVVRPGDRRSAAGLFTLSRQIPVAVSPTIAAYLMQAFGLTVPMFVGGALQFFHDRIYRLFRDVRPPEDHVAVTRSATASL